MKAVTVKAVVGIKEVLEACMNLIYPPQRIVLIGQQLDLVRVVCLAEEAEFFDQDMHHTGIAGKRFVPCCYPTASFDATYDCWIAASNSTPVGLS